MNCQIETAEAIIGAEVDYLLSAKGNQEALMNDIAEYIQDTKIINTVTYLPWYLVVVVSQVFILTSPDSGIDQSLWYQLLTYVLGIIQSYGSYIAQMVGMVGIAFEYFHIREKREGVTVETEISNFANL